jgi:hypothetical protein
VSERFAAWQDSLDTQYLAQKERKLVAIEKPAGMAGQWEDVKWPYDLKRSGRSEIFSWTRVMANGKPITHEVNRNFWDLARRYQAILRNELHPSEKSPALSTIFQKTYAVLGICDFAIKLGLSSLREFAGQHYQELLAEFQNGRTGLSEKQVTRGRLDQIFSVLDDLHDLFVHPDEDGLYLLNDGLRFASFLSVDDRRALARKGKDPGQTDDAPEEIVFAHVAASIEYVALYSDDILELKERWRVAKAGMSIVTRARPGQVAAKVAQVLLQAMDAGPSSEFFRDNSVDKKRLAVASGIDVPTLYKKRFAPVIGPVEAWLCTRTDVAGERARIDLNKCVAAFDAISHRPLERCAPAAQVGLPFSGRPGKFAPWPLTALGSGRFGGASLESAEADLWTSCYLLVLAYIGLRLGEGLTIKTDCIVKRVDGFYIRYRTSKGANSEGGSLVEQPCPEIVVRAVQIALRLGTAAREEFGGDELFFVAHRHGASVLEDSAVRQRLEFFGRRTGASVLETGGERPVLPSEMRRFFVTMWVNYYEYAGKYESLRRFLNHAWITTTVRYGLRRNEKPRISEAQLALAVKVLARKLLDGAGPLADLPKSILPFLQKLQVRALPVAELLRELRTYAEDQGLALFAMPWGYCLWHYSAGKYAQCLEASLRRIGTERIDAGRSCGGCDGCQNLVRDHIFNPFYESGMERHAKIAGNSHASSFLRQAAGRFVATAKSALGRAGL